MDSPRLHDNRHEIVINTCDQKKVFDEIVLWGEASWWPRRCMMKFTRIGNLPIQKGTMYHQAVRLPLGPRWLSLVTEIIDNASISRKYFESFIEGDETVRVAALERSMEPHGLKSVVPGEIPPLASSIMRWRTPSANALWRMAGSSRLCPRPRTSSDIPPKQKCFAFLHGLKSVPARLKAGGVSCEGGMKVEYLLTYSIQGRFKRMLWKLCLERMHNYNIRLILNALKRYLEQ